jgi:hypothetical protein
MRLTRNFQHSPDTRELKNSANRRSAGNLSANSRIQQHRPSGSVTRNISPRQYLHSESSEKSQRDSNFDSGICKFCAAPKDFEGKMTRVLDEVCSNLQKVISAYEAWDKGKTPKFNPRLSFKSSISENSEGFEKMQEVNLMCCKVQGIIGQLTEDVARLAKVSPWMSVSIRKPAANAMGKSLQDAILEAQKRIGRLKEWSKGEVIEKQEASNRTLVLALMESLRERRMLEVKIGAGNNLSTENIAKVIERLVQEHQMTASNR